MEKIEATFRIVTPMFIGGADQMPSDGIRPPSVKGALRFWWRALNWGEFYKNEKNEAKALQKLHAAEAALFGSAADSKGGGGQGSFLLTVQERASTHPEQQIDIGRFNGKAYLAGMGLSDRSALPLGKNFNITLVFRNKKDQIVLNQMKDTLRIFGLVGGLGSRNRRGFGSISTLIKDDDGWRVFTEAEINTEYEWLKKQLFFDGPTPFSALSSNSLFYHGDDFSRVEDALENVGNLMNRYRTNGTSVIKDSEGRVTRTAKPGYRIVGNSDVPESSLKFYKTDHHHAYEIAKSRRVDSPHDVPPERSIFGLPYPYRFSSCDGVSVNFDYMQGREKGRRASPLFVHVSVFSNNHGQLKYRPLLLLLQAEFLPPNTQLNVSVNKSSVGSVSAPSDYKPIKDFLSTKFTEC